MDSTQGWVETWKIEARAKAELNRTVELTPPARPVSATAILDPEIDATMNDVRSEKSKRSKKKAKKAKSGVVNSSLSDDSGADSELNQTSRDEKEKRKRKKKAIPQKAAARKKTVEQKASTSEDKGRKRARKVYSSDDSSDDNASESPDSGSDLTSESDTRNQLRRRAARLKAPAITATYPRHYYYLQNVATPPRPLLE
jgi:hypothetical protein